MSFGQNVQFLRKMHRGMTQEELAEQMNVSRQTVSKWELDAAFPEMEKAIALAKLFSCSIDELLQGDLNSGNEAYINIRQEVVEGFTYACYVVISCDPEGDSQEHITKWAKRHGIDDPQMIGWDFPFLSQEQINVYHMHGYAAACILPEGFDTKCEDMRIVSQPSHAYAAITIKDPFAAPFVLIPNAYKTLMRYMDVNAMKHKESKEIASCFEKVYETDGVTYMDVYIAMEA
ncbi:MAG: helix-turn-helix transcriptional regulator [Clostridiales bacterium]|nr:helix-turn-helix transcriptional regulator [Clostridiales bacterium]